MFFERKFFMLHRRYFIYGFIGILIFIENNASVAQIPQWYLEKKFPKYSSEEFWLGVGSAKGTDTKALETATNSARTDIAAQFKVRVSSNIQSVQKEIISGKNSELSSTIENRTESVVDATELVGLQTVKTEISRNDNQTYVMVALEKSAFLSFVKKNLDENVKRMEQKVLSAKEFSIQAKANVALTSFLDALDDYDTCYPQILFYNALASSFYSPPKIVMPEVIESEMKSYLSGISLSIVSGNAQRGEIGKNLSEQFATKATVRTSDAELPLKGMSIVFKIQKDVIATALSDENGIATHTFLTEAKGVSGGRGSVTAMIDLKNVSGELRSLVANNTTVNFEFFLEQKSIACNVEIIGTGSAKAKEIFRKKIVQLLEKNGAIIDEKATILVKATLNAESGGAVEGMSGTMFTQNIFLAIEFIDEQSSRIVSAVSATGKGLGKSDSEAIDKGISSLKIPMRELGTALAKVRNQ
jgi:hypothetical protein